MDLEHKVSFYATCDACFQGKEETQLFDQPFSRKLVGTDVWVPVRYCQPCMDRLSYKQADRVQE